MKPLETIKTETQIAIVKACNPSCTLEEALEKELVPGCKIKEKGGVFINTLYSKGCSDDGEKYYHFYTEEGYSDNETADKFKILGLPLTLDRVLRVLNANIKGGKRYGYEPHRGMMRFDNLPTEMYRNKDYIRLAIDWDLTKPTLEEQSEETQRAIHKILTNG